MNETNQLTVEESIIEEPIIKEPIIEESIISEPIIKEPIILTLINPELIDSAPPNPELLSAPIRRTINIVSPESSPIDQELINLRK